MIKRILLVLIGVVAAAVMISTAAHAVDLENSTFEDGNGRFVLAGAAAVVFLTCMYFLVADLSEARWARALQESGHTGPSRVADPHSITERLVTRPTEQASPAPGNTRWLIGGTQQSVATTDDLPSPSSPPSHSRSAAGLFGATTPPPRASSADGLFGSRVSGTERNDIGRGTGPGSAVATRNTAPSPESGAPAPAPAEPPPSEPPPAEPAPPPAPDPEPALVVETPKPASLPEPATIETPHEESADELAERSPIVLRDYDPGDIDRTIDENNRLAVNSLVESGTLSDKGPLRPEDIRTMLFIALSSEQLRSLLHEARDDEPIRPVRHELPSAPSTELTASTPAADSHPDDELPRWQVIVEPENGLDNDNRADRPGPDDEPPSSGYLYATGGN